ncbi:MAG: hypothetical protein IJD78_06015 [Clostridia bacterium]|nr:hypothetical protein [Clostridia bacterium]
MNILKKAICSVMVLILTLGLTACGGNVADEPAVEFPFAELNEIYDSDDTAKGDRFDEKNSGRRYIVNSVTVKNVSFKSSTEYDVFCYVKSGERTFNFRLYVDTTLGDVTREYLDSLEKDDVISFEGSFLSQTSRSYLSSFNNIKFL